MSGTAVVVAIDGPAGSGKSTLARRLAQTLDLPYLNTGLMYRALTLQALQRGVDPDDADGLAALAKEITFDLDWRVRPPELTIDGSRASEQLQSTDVESRVSQVARHPHVREVLRAEQRRLSERGGVVEGRDIGAVVAPHADVKLYLQAAQSERISRRINERTAPAEPVGDALSARDALDARTNPFRPADDAIAIDTTGMTSDQVYEKALATTRARLAQRGRR
ncbi:MAG TPA: (d)CMP kinase [Actinomycetota bacterium]|nr:(d)CMP kinase [Actinomycetota bacterium]